MKIKISDKGLLFLERAGKLKLQSCPFNSNDGPCGDWCPLFNEEALHAKHPILELCRAFYDIDLYVIDRRKPQFASGPYPCSKCGRGWINEVSAASCCKENK